MAVGSKTPRNATRKEEEKGENISLSLLNTFAKQNLA